MSIGLTSPSSAGTHYYGACVEPVSGESDTGNNCSSAVAVTDAPRVSPAGASKLYWTDAGASGIQRANLDGSQVDDLVTSGLGSPTGLAVDLSGGKMYWTDRRTDRIQRANLDGSHVEDLVTSGLDKPNGLALDGSGRKMYWADAGTNKIQRANLDGSNVEDLLTGADGLVDPSGVAVGGVPSPFRIEIVFLESSTVDGFSASQKALFHEAAARWMSIITGDIPDSDFSDNPVDEWDDDLKKQIRVNDFVDDLRIFVGRGEIDGAKGTLGRGGTLIARRNRSNEQCRYEDRNDSNR